MAPKQELDFQPQLPVQMAKPETHLAVELMATSQENPPAEAIQSASELVMGLAPAMWQPPPVMLQEMVKRDTHFDSELLVRLATAPLETLQENPLAPAM
jgi:hypothetical protein